MPLLIVSLVACLLGPWPPALSLSSAEVQRGATLTAVANAPAGADVALRLPVGVSAALQGRQGETVIWRLTVAPDAPMSRTPRLVVLLVDRQPSAVAPLRIWTDAVPAVRVWLPVVRGG